MPLSIEFTFRDHFIYLLVTAGRAAVAVITKLFTGYEIGFARYKIPR